MKNRRALLRPIYQLAGCISLGILFCAATLWTHPQIDYLASSADALSLIDLVRDLVQGASMHSWNLPRAPSFFPDQLFALFALALTEHLPAIIIFISVLNYCCLCIVLWLVLKNIQSNQESGLLQISLIVSAVIMSIVTLLPDTLGTIFYQLFTLGTHLGSALLTLVVVYLLQERPKKLHHGYALSLLFVLGVLGSLSNSLFTLLLLVWLGKETLCKGPRQLISQAQYLVLLLSMVVGTLLNWALPRQSLKESFFAPHLWLHNLSDFAHHLLTTPSALIFYCLLIGAALVWPFWEKGKTFSPSGAFKMVLSNDLSPLALSLIAITPVLYQEWNSLRYLMFPSLVLMLSLSAKYLFYQANLSQTRQTRKLLPLYIFIAIVGGLFFLPKPEPDQTSEVINDGLRCIRAAQKNAPLSDGIASYWNARPIRFASNFKYFLAQVKPDFPQMGFFFWGNNGSNFVYTDHYQSTLRNYNYIVATQKELEQGKWGPITTQATTVFPCEKTTVLYYADVSILWNFLFTKKQDPIPHTLEGLLAKQALFLKERPQIFVANALYTQTGTIDQNKIHAGKQAGYLVYGPYLNLDAGKYQLKIQGSISSGHLEITADDGSVTILKKPLNDLSPKASPQQSFEFSIPSPKTRVEFRIFTPINENGYFESFELRQLAGP